MFDALYARYREPVLAYFARRTAEPEVAADLMAETFARALVQYRRRPPDHPAAWVFAIARNVLIDSARRGRVEASARRRLKLEPLVLDDHDIERIAEIAAAADLGELIKRTLPDAEYALLHARLVDEQPYADLARSLRCSEQVVRKRVSRAIAHVRDAIGDADA